MKSKFEKLCIYVGVAAKCCGNDEDISTNDEFSDKVVGFIVAYDVYIEYEARSFSAFRT